MKHCLLYLVIATLIPFAWTNCYGQEKGSFIKLISDDTDSLFVSFYVPEDYNPIKKYALVVGYPPGGDPNGGSMRDMLIGAAAEKKFIIACPDRHVIDGYAGALIAYNYCMNTYNIHPDKVITTGYSAGGATAFAVYERNPEKFIGVIGIAASIGGMKYESVYNRRFGFIVGDQDGASGANKGFANALERNGADVLFILKEGVGHFSGYFGSPEFLKDWGDCFSFICEFNPGPQVQLSSPEDSAYGFVDNVNLKWEEIENAIGYEIKVRTYLDEIAHDSSSSASFDFQGLEPGVVYYWKVRAIFEDAIGLWSQQRMLRAKCEKVIENVTLYLPANNQKNHYQQAPLSWYEIDNADKYHIQLSTDEFETMVTNDSTVPSYSANGYKYGNYRYGILEPKTQYWWRVRGGNPEGWTDWTEVWTFTTVDPNSVEDHSEIPGMTVNLYPNPTVDDLRLDIQSESTGKAKLKIFNALGNEVTDLGIIDLDKEYSAAIKTASLQQGVYFIEIRTNSGVMHKKFIVKR